MFDGFSGRLLRCAVYTRKSSEEGLEQAFNSLHAQRDACEAYIKSQQHEGWTLIPTAYDDGAYSGGNMQRPALQALLAEVKAGKIDVIVVYKVDRLTRSLPDFARIVDVLDSAKASFVSVTQAFNTTTSMGRLTLNVLLSFAQFEREVTGERIRDKIAASKVKGMWMGGLPPLGYDAKDRSLVVNAMEAETVRQVFDLFHTLRSVDKVKVEADRLGLRTKTRKRPGQETVGGQPFSRGTLYHLLENPLYAGRVAHKAKRYAGLHSPIIEASVFEEVQAQIAKNRHARKLRTGAEAPSPLAGLIFDDHGRRLTPTHTSKSGRRYRYYVAAATVDHDIIRLPASDIERAVRAKLIEDLESPHTVLAALVSTDATAVTKAIGRAKRLAMDLLGADAAAFRQWTHRHVDRITVGETEIRITLKTSLFDHATSALTSIAPMKIERRGADLKLVIGDAPRRGPDPTLIKLIGLGAGWFEDIKDGRVRTIDELARREGVTRPYISRVIELAFLSPQIKQRIMAGEQPIGMTTSQLRTLCPLPLAWSEQEELFTRQAARGSSG